MIPRTLLVALTLVGCSDGECPAGPYDTDCNGLITADERAGCLDCEVACAGTGSIMSVVCVRDGIVIPPGDYGGTRCSGSVNDADHEGVRAVCVGYPTCERAGGFRETDLLTPQCFNVTGGTVDLPRADICADCVATDVSACSGDGACAGCRPACIGETGHGWDEVGITTTPGAPAHCEVGTYLACVRNP